MSRDGIISPLPRDVIFRRLPVRVKVHVMQVHIMQECDQEHKFTNYYKYAATLNCTYN